MKRVVVITCLSLSLASLPLLADETASPSLKPKPVQTADLSKANLEAATETGDQVATTEEETPAAPTTEELASKVDSLTEAFTTLQTTVDLLGKMKLSGYLQAQYVNDESSVNALSSATATRNKDQFSIRRGRIKFTYQFSPTSKFVMQPDITSSGVVLKDGYIEYTEPWTPWHHTLTAGQFNWPFGFEIMYSSSDREMPERTRVFRTLFPGERDRGVMLSGVGMGDRFNYRAALVNGTGTNQTFDFNKRKDFVGRVGGSVGPLDLGASWYRGNDLVSVTPATAGREFEKTRLGVDFQLVTPVPGLGVRGEYIKGKQPPNPGASAAASLSADVVGYYFYAIQNVGTRNQFVVRYDSYDPDTENKLANVIANARVGTLGLCYIFHWDANSKVMMAYEKLKTSGFVDPKDNVFTLRYQYKF